MLAVNVLEESAFFFNWKKLRKKILVTPIVLQILQHKSCSMMVVLLYVHKIM